MTACGRLAGEAVSRHPGSNSSSFSYSLCGIWQLGQIVSLLEWMVSSARPPNIHAETVGSEWAPGPSVKGKVRPSSSRSEPGCQLLVGENGSKRHSPLVGPQWLPGTYRTRSAGHLVIYQSGSPPSDSNLPFHCPSYPKEPWTPVSQNHATIFAGL